MSFNARNHVRRNQSTSFHIGSSITTYFSPCCVQFTSFESPTLFREHGQWIVVRKRVLMKQTHLNYFAVHLFFFLLQRDISVEVSPPELRYVEYRSLIFLSRLSVHPFTECRSLDYKSLPTKYWNSLNVISLNKKKCRYFYKYWYLKILCHFCRIFSSAWNVKNFCGFK